MFATKEDALVRVSKECDVVGRRGSGSEDHQGSVHRGYLQAERRCRATGRSRSGSTGRHSWRSRACGRGSRRARACSRTSARASGPHRLRRRINQPAPPPTVELGQTKDMVVAILGQPQKTAKLTGKDLLLQGQPGNIQRRQSLGCPVNRVESKESFMRTSRISNAARRPWSALVAERRSADIVRNAAGAGQDIRSGGAKPAAAAPQAGGGCSQGSGRGQCGGTCGGAVVGGKCRRSDCARGTCGRTQQPRRAEEPRAAALAASGRSGAAARAVR